MLTLVRPQEGALRRRGIPSRHLRLTDEEVRHLRASTRNIARRHFGTLAALARALEVNPNVLARKRRPSAALAVALWRLTGIPLEDILRGKLEAAPALAPLPGKDGAR